MNPELSIRRAVVEDVPLLLEWIRKLAEYERLQDEVTATEERLKTSLFGSNAPAAALLAFEAGRPAGFAVYYFGYSTFKAGPILYLEDIFVDAAVRGRGIGKQLFRRILVIASEADCERVEWSVLDWNESARDFYERLGAGWKKSWLRYELSPAAVREALRQLEAR